MIPSLAPSLLRGEPSARSIGPILFAHPHSRGQAGSGFSLQRGPWQRLCDGVQNDRSMPKADAVEECSGAVNASSFRGLTTRSAASSPEYITPEQVVALETMAQDKRIDLGRLKSAAKVGALAMIHATDYDRAKSWLEKAAAP